MTIKLDNFKTKVLIPLIARTPSFWTEWGDMIAIKVAPIIDARIPTPNSNGKTILTFLALTISAVVIPSCNVCIATSSSIKVTSCIVIFIVTVVVISPLGWTTISIILHSGWRGCGYSCWVETLAWITVIIPIWGSIVATSASIKIASCIVIFIITKLIIGPLRGATATRCLWFLKECYFLTYKMILILYSSCNCAWEEFNLAKALQELTILDLIVIKASNVTIVQKESLLVLYLVAKHCSFCLPANRVQLDLITTEYKNWQNTYSWKMDRL